MTRTRHFLFSAIVGAGFAAGCGDDDTKGNTETVDTAVQDSTIEDTFVPPDTVTPDTVTTDTGIDTSVATETTQQEVVNECTPEEAGKGKIGSPCTKNCQCGDDHGETICYSGLYMEGFSFCTHESDGRTSNSTDVGYATLQFSGDCYPGVTPPNRPPLYAHICNTVDDCKALGAAYNACGTAHLDYHSGGGGTQCPTPTSARDLTLWKTCIIDTLPPFNRANLE